MLLARLRTPFARAFAAPEILAPALAFAAIEIAAAAYVIARRGTEFVPLLVLAGLAVAFYAVLGWLAGRHPLAESAPDPVRSPRLEAFAIGIAYVGLAGWGFGVLPFGMHLFLGGLCGWIAAAVLGGYRRGAGVRTYRCSSASPRRSC
jgi:hypothetical protein